MSFLRAALLTRPWSLVTLAVLYTLLNAPKPLLVDDAAYYYYARQIAHDPTRPYGFEVFWYDMPQSANTVLAPPGLPYWWSLAYQLFGERPFWWKVWLLPYSLILVFALDALLRRFAHGMETPLLWMTVLSPTLLPSLNLMLDVPALALSLGSIAVFFRACARNSLVLALAAGAVAGLGMETKYTVFLAPAVMLLYALLFWRPLQGLIAATTAALLFVSWETFVAWRHGQSHFLVALTQQGGAWGEKWNLAGPFLTIVGGVGPAVVLLGLVACGIRRRTTAVLIVVFALGYYLLASTTAEVNWHVNPTFADDPSAPSESWPLEYVIFGLCGILALIVTAVGIFLLFFRRDETSEDFVLEPASPAWQSPFRRLDLFLVLWLLGEVAGYFMLTPFPAVRRVMGVVVVGTLLAGRLASRRCRAPDRRVLVWTVAAVGIVLGFVFYGVDMVDAFAEKDAAEEAAALVRSHDPDAHMWYCGHWGFQYYAERQGMTVIDPYISERNLGKMLHKGDWLVVPDFMYVPPNRWGHLMVYYSLYVEDKEKIRTRQVGPPVEIRDSLPLATVMGFYGGQMPLHSHEGARARVRIYQVLRDYTPAYGYPIDPEPR